MGGGPLMGMACMFMVEYAFARAKKLRKKTMVLGCGVGPMRKKVYERSLVNIIQKSDATVFRDDTSRLEYNRISGGRGNDIAAIDPAVFAALCFRENTGTPERDDVIVAAVREFPDAYKISKSIQSDVMNKLIIDFLRRLCSCNKPIQLLPMHYFGVGYDDRIFMNQIKNKLGDNAVFVQNNPLSLYETLGKFTGASMCVGMRFHSVVLQTILNGNNIILDYTDPGTGKIGNFVRQIGAEECYRNRYVALQTAGNTLPELYVDKPFAYNGKLLDEFKNNYISVMKDAI
jgi:polysaccharide pyruvyl transferase WcaK-like protein